MRVSIRHIMGVAMCAVLSGCVSHQAQAAKVVIKPLLFNDDVTMLTEDTFDEFISQPGATLVMFVSPLCGGCKEFVPEYNKVATELRSSYPPVRTASVDFYRFPELGAREGITSTPIMKLYSDTVGVRHYGARPRRGHVLLKWVQDQLAPSPIKQLATASAVKSHKRAAKVTLVVHHNQKLTPAQRGSLNEVAREFNDIPFARVTKPKASAELNAPAPALILQKSFDSGRAVYTGDLTDVAAMTEFVQINRLPVVSVYNHDLARLLFADNPTLLVLVADTDAEGYDELLERFRSVALLMYGRMRSVVVPTSFDRIIGGFNVAAEDAPALMITAPGVGGSLRMKRYVMDTTPGNYAGITTTKLAEFTASFNTGSLAPALKSSDAPAVKPGSAQARGTLQELVGSTFSSVADSADFHTIVMWYTPWCKETCEKARKMMTSIARKYQQNKAVVVGQIDFASNEVDRDDVKLAEFPIIYYFPAGSRGAPAEKYDGDHSSTDMEAWLEARGLQRDPARGGDEL